MVAGVGCISRCKNVKLMIVEITQLELQNNIVMNA